MCADIIYAPVGMGACRLADGTIHLGHYNGCFRPDKVKTINELLFVIQDNSFIGLYPFGSERSALVRFLGQLYSLSTQCRITACLQTGIFASYARLLDVARRVVTVRLLETTHPKKREIAVKQALY